MLKHGAKLIVFLVLGLLGLTADAREFLTRNAQNSVNIATFNPANPTELNWHSLELIPPQDNSSLTQTVQIAYDGSTYTVTCDGSWQTLISTYPEIPVKISCTLGNPDPNGIINSINVSFLIYDQTTYSQMWPDSPGNADPDLGETYCRAYTEDPVCEWVGSCTQQYCMKYLSGNCDSWWCSYDDWSSSSGCCPPLSCTRYVCGYDWWTGDPIYCTECDLQYSLPSCPQFGNLVKCGTASRRGYCGGWSYFWSCSKQYGCYSYTTCTTTYRCPVNNQTYSSSAECEANCRGEDEDCLDFASPYCETDSNGVRACKWQVLNDSNRTLTSRGVAPGMWVVYARTEGTVALSFDVQQSGVAEGSWCAVDANGNGEVEEGEFAACVEADDGTPLCPVRMSECTATYSDPICPEGSTFNPDTDLCEAPPEIRCPENFAYDADTDRCVTPALCPLGGSLNREADRCELHLSSAWCPSGYTWSESLKACIRSPVCPEGGGYDPALDLCVHAPVPDCPDGFGYDGTTGVCHRPVQCPSGTAYSSSLDRCAAEPTITCPSGTAYSAASGLCEAPPACPDGGSYDASRDVCTASPDLSCPSGYTYNPSTARCEAAPQCPSGTTYDSARNVCAADPTYICPSGTAYSSATGKCEASPTCPAGGSYSASLDRCIQSPSWTCPPGYTYNSSARTCETSPSCPSGATYDTSSNLCIASPSWTCPSGMTYNSSTGRCEASPACPSGGSYHTGLDRCTAYPGYSCPSGYTYSSSTGRCEAPPQCPSGFTYSAAHNKCLKPAAPTCPSGYTYNSSAGKCQASPQCPSGFSYNSSTNRCEASPNYSCPSGTSYNPSTGKCETNPTQQCSTKYCKTQYGWSYSCWGDKLDVSGCCPRDKRTFDQMTDCANAGVPVRMECPSRPLRPKGWFRKCYYYPIGGTRCGMATRSYTCGYHSPSSTKWYCYSYQQCTPTCPSGTTYNSSTGKCETSPLSSCPSGSTLSGSICVANPTCPSGGSLNTSTDKCELAPTPSCPSGSSYDSSVGQCVASATCPSGGSLNHSTDKCELVPMPACTSPYAYSSTSGLCEASAQCPSGSALNGSTDRCEAAPTPGCPSGTSYSSSLGRCTAAASCPPPGSLNGSTDRCEVAATASCTSPYSYSSSSGLCEASAQCPSGTSLNGSTDRCEANPQISCPSGTSYSSSLGKCTASASCPSPGSLNTSADKCEAAVVRSCGPPYTYSSSTGLCEASATCASGSQLNGSTDRCEADPQITCPSGTSFDRSLVLCTAVPNCSPGYLSGSRDRCEIAPAPTCLAGYTLSGNRCQAPPSCPAGSLNTAADLCVVPAVQLCPAPYTWQDPTCTAEPQCPAGSEYSTELDLCATPAEHLCPSGTEYSSLSRLCEAYRICQAGAYDPEANGCYEGNNTCPFGNYPCVPYQGRNVCTPDPCYQAEEGIEDVDPYNQGANDPQNDGQWTEDGQCIGTVYIFSGKDMRCRLPGIETGWFNCCDGGDTWFGMGRCNGTEEALAQLKKRGVCHKVGTYCSKKLKLVGICLQKKATYCCFSSKLARIVHEQGRPQLQPFVGNLWGKPKSPRCRGFTIEEFQMLDFDRIDLSEWYGDIIVRSQQEMAAEIQTRFSQYMERLGQ